MCLSVCVNTLEDVNTKYARVEINKNSYSCVYVCSKLYTYMHMTVTGIFYKLKNM